MNDQELLNLFTDVCRLHITGAERNLNRMNLQVGQGAVIHTLGLHGEMAQNKIAKIRKVSPATISVMIRRMEANGLVQRRNDETDAKINLISLTEQGQEAFEQMQEDNQDRPAQIFAGFSEKEKVQAGEIFQKLFDNLENLK